MSERRLQLPKERPHVEPWPDDYSDGDLMRHSSISTTMAYYVSQTAEDVGDVLRAAIGNNPGNNAAEAVVSVDIDNSEKHVTIRT